MRMTALFCTLMMAAPASAQIASHCIAVAEGVSGIRFVSSFGDDLNAEDVRINYVGHSTFVIETADGTTIATDFTGFVGAGVTPDVVTMNNAHSSHWTPNPDPAIPHVLKGWKTGGTPADHYLELGPELLIRNVTTDQRGGAGGRNMDNNSIFIFEIAGLCIGHLGHLHHEPSDAQYAAIGRLDVVMVPVDGGMTVDIGTVKTMLNRMKSLVVLPMHWFGGYTLERFVAAMSETFDVEYAEGNSVTLSLASLPEKPTVRVMMPAPLSGGME